MDIRIKQLTLHNFKGIREAVFSFDGSNARIEGENGAGKSTVFDAFTWLLFGKDHRGQDQTNFDIKPIDPETGEHLHGLEHWVEGSLLVDGVERVLRREWAENWVKPKGEAQKVLKGHTSRFFIDGVDVVTKAAYDAEIHKWIDEEFFKVITNPLYFIDDRYTDWKARRKAVLALGGGSELASVADQFADLLREMRGDTVETFRKRVAAAKKENKTRLAEASANIAAFTRLLPEPVDLAEVERKAKEVETELYAASQAVKDEIAAVDEKISDVNKANSARDREIDVKNAEISKIRLRMGNLLEDGEKAAQRGKEEQRKRLSEIRATIDDRAARIAELERDLRRWAGDIEDAQNARTELAAELRRMGDEFRETKEAAFDYTQVTVCPTCGRQIPEDQLAADREKHLAAFQDARREKLKTIADLATKVKEEIAGFDRTIETVRARIEARRDEDLAGLKKVQERDILLEKGMAAQTAIDYSSVEEAVRATPEYRELAQREQALQAEILALRGETISVNDLLFERRNLEGKRESILMQITERTRPLAEARAAAGERERILGEIEKEKGREAAFADEVARLERLEFQVSDYVKATVEAQESGLNARFRVARWKMFERTMDGGMVEMCEVTDTKGVPYRSMNDAQKIRCGMDVIRVFSEEYEATAPVFIDNAEGCTQERFDTTAQVIRLVVKAGASLTMVKE